MLFISPLFTSHPHHIVIIYIARQKKSRSFPTPYIQHLHFVIVFMIIFFGFLTDDPIFLGTMIRYKDHLCPPPFFSIIHNGKLYNVSKILV